MNKEKNVITYIVEWDDPELKKPDTLYRYIRNEEGSSSEAMNSISDGEWYEDSGAMALRTETHNIYYDRVTEEEAEKIAIELCGSIHNE